MNDCIEDLLDRAERASPRERVVHLAVAAAIARRGGNLGLAVSLLAHAYELRPTSGAVAAEIAHLRSEADEDLHRLLDANGLPRVSQSLHEPGLRRRGP